MSRDRRCKTKCCQLVARSECLSTLTSFIHSLPTLCQRREKIATIFHSCCYWSPFAAINWHSQFAIRESQSRVKPKLNKLKLQFRLSGKLYWTDSHDALARWFRFDFTASLVQFRFLLLLLLLLRHSNHSRNVRAEGARMLKHIRPCSEHVRLAERSLFL